MPAGNSGLFFVNFFILLLDNMRAFIYCIYRKKLKNDRPAGQKIAGQKGENMEIRIKETQEVIAKITTNRSMTIWDACELAGINVTGEDPEYDAEADLEMVY